MIREAIAGIIAIIFVATFLLLVRAAYSTMENAAAFGSAKELLAIVNAIVGVIVGYYFSRMTTEARAERAEATADDATQTAARATENERAAKDQVTAITADGTQTRAALAALKDAAQEILGPAAGHRAGAVAGGAPPAPPDPAALARLAAAVREADRRLNG
jgi:uncharacterized membrane protein YcjF (UPF0283 family)